MGSWKKSIVQYRFPFAGEYYCYMVSLGRCSNILAENDCKECDAHFKLSENNK